MTLVMKPTMRSMPLWRVALWATIIGLLMLPLIAMQFTGEVRWDTADFVVAAALLTGAGLLYEVAARTIVDRRRRYLAGALLVVAVLVVWAQGAVGI